jgi:hypothetical protein
LGEGADRVGEHQQAAAEGQLEHGLVVEAGPEHAAALTAHLLGHDGTRGRIGDLGGATGEGEAVLFARWREVLKVEVLVRASPDALSAFGEVFGDAAAKALEAAPSADEDGFRNVTLTFEHEAAAVQRLAGFGGEVEVLAPVTVRDRLIATARQLLSRYPVEE